MRITPATEITLTGILLAIVCFASLLVENYHVVLLAYLAVIATDMLDGREARRSGKSFFGHVCDRIIRDTLFNIVVFVLIVAVLFDGKIYFWGACAISAELFFFWFNIICAFFMIPERRTYYFFWNYFKQPLYAALGLVVIYTKVGLVEIILIVGIIGLAAFSIDRSYCEHVKGKSLGLISYK